MQISKLLSGKNILKSILFIVIVWWIFFLDSHTWNMVWAQVIEKQTSSDQAVQAIDTILKIIYMVFYPLIFIAGLAMDNSLIYWEVFHLDVPLWKFWNIVKNLANFTLGFLVLFTILKNVFNLWKKVEDVKKIITNTLIAGVLIQASRFLTAALIDISTVATYGIWALPMSVIGETDVWKQKILAIDSTFDVNKSYDQNQRWEALMNSFRVKYNGKDMYLSPCKIAQNMTWWDSFIIWRQYSDKKFQNYDSFGWWTACILNGNQVVRYNEFSELKWKEWSSYENELNWILSVDKDRHPREFCGYIININWANKGSCGDWFDTLQSIYTAQLPEWADNSLTPWLVSANTSNIWIEAGQIRFEDDKVEAMTISKLIDKSKWMVGPMMTMFSSIMNFSQLSDNSARNWVWAITMETIIKLLFALAIFFPLLALAIVLVVRIWLLRLIVVASPFLVLAEVFGDQIKWLKDMLKWFDITNVIKIVFSPVITVFALSMSIIFMQTLISGLNTNGDSDCTRQTETFESMQISPVYQDGSCKTDEYKLLWWLISIKASWSENRTWTADLFSWTIVNVFAIALIWFIVFASFKASWTILEKVGKWVQDFWSSVMKTAPIMPIPSVWNVWLWTFKDQVFGTGSGNAIWNKKISNMEQSQEAALEKKFFPEENWWTGKEGEWTKNDNEQKNNRIIEYVNKSNTPKMDDIKNNEKITTDYMTRADTIKAIEEKLSTEEKKNNALISKYTSLIAESMEEELKENDTKKTIENLLRPIFESKDVISKKYMEWLINDDVKNKFEVKEWQDKWIYKIKNQNTFELEKFTSPATPPAPITTP